MSLSSLQNAYMLATSCTLEEHSRRPDNISCLSLAQALLEKASAAAEAAAQHPTPPKELLTARKALHTLVCPCPLHASALQRLNRQGRKELEYIL